MTKDASFKKEVQNRKKEFEDKKIELISRLCTEEDEDQNKKSKKVILQNKTF